MNLSLGFDYGKNGDCEFRVVMEPADTQLGRVGSRRRQEFRDRSKGFFHGRLPPIRRHWQRSASAASCENVVTFFDAALHVGLMPELSSTDEVSRPRPIKPAFEPSTPPSNRAPGLT
jgi:hypothetical protein